MIYIFDLEERLTAILSNENKNACPYYGTDETEVLSGEHTFTFRVPLLHPDAEQIDVRRLVAVRDPDGAFTLFTVTEIEEFHGTHAEKTVFCENASVELLDDIILSQEIKGARPAQALDTILSGTRWSTGTATGTNTQSMNISNESVLEALQRFFNRWGGEPRFRVTIVGNRIASRFVDFFAIRGTETGKRIEYEKDTEHIRRTIDARNIKTALYGIGGEIEGKEGEFTTFTALEGRSFLVDETARARWGRLEPNGTTKRHLFGIYFSTTKDPATLRNETREALKHAVEPSFNYEVKAIDLGELTGAPHERVRLGDTLYIIDRDLKLQLRARVIERRIDRLDPTNNEYTLGNFAPLFTNELNRQQSELEKQEVNFRQALENIGNVDLTGVVREGDVIFTHWLEREMKLNNQAIIAGGGTVHISDKDGVVITDKPTIAESTQAIQLVAGKLALANSKHPDGSFNFRAFGTADGFLADLVQTGFIRFDRARGGTLTLGGERLGTNPQTNIDIFEHGILEVLNENGDKTVTLDGRQGGFERLFIGHLDSPNVVTKQLDDIRYHIDPKSGNDSNDGTISAPLETIQEALNRIPKYNNYVVTIQVRDDVGRFTEPELRIEGFYGQGDIRLLLGNRNIMIGEISIIGNQNWIYIGTVNGSGTGVDTNNKAEIRNQNAEGSGRGVITCERNAYVYLSRVILNGNNLVFYGLFTMADTLVRSNRVEYYNVSYACMLAGNGATVENITNQGLSERGIFARDGGIVCGQGSIPWGTSQHVQTVRGAIYNGLTLTPDMGKATPVYELSKTTIWTPNNTRSFATHNVGWISDYVYNGKRPNDPPLWYGVIFFNTRSFADLKNPDGTNRPITRVRLRLIRTNNTGENTARRPLLYTSTQTSMSGTPNTYGTAFRSTVSYTWGQTNWITLPIRFGEEFQRGTARSIVLYDTSREADYMRFEPTGIQLEITHG